VRNPGIVADIQITHGEERRNHGQFRVADMRRSAGVIDSICLKDVSNRFVFSRTGIEENKRVTPMPEFRKKVAIAAERPAFPGAAAAGMHGQ
jgi:hypothetical protein